MHSHTDRTYIETATLAEFDRVPAAVPPDPEAISRRVARFYLERAMRALEAADGQIDIVGSGSDIPDVPATGPKQAIAKARFEAAEKRDVADLDDFFPLCVIEGEHRNIKDEV